jgi:hypothetical protein
MIGGSRSRPHTGHNGGRGKIRWSPESGRHCGKTFVVVETHLPSISVSRRFAFLQSAQLDVHGLSPRSGCGDWVSPGRGAA